MQARAARLRGRTRLHDPTVDEPLITVVVDELAALTAYAERDDRRRINAALSLLLSQGRAVGVVVVAALQDPRKETLPFRDLFPTRIALAFAEAEQTDLVLGPRAPGCGGRTARASRSPPRGSGGCGATANPNPSASGPAGSPTTDIAAMVEPTRPATSRDRHRRRRRAVTWSLTTAQERRAPAAVLGQGSFPSWRRSLRVGWVKARRGEEVPPEGAGSRGSLGTSSPWP